jgi:hypothetical protein
MRFIEKPLAWIGGLLAGNVIILVLLAVLVGAVNNNIQTGAKLSIRIASAEVKIVTALGSYMKHIGDDASTGTKMGDRAYAELNKA